MKKLDLLEEKLGVKFNNRQILNRALTHRSYLNEAKEKSIKSNERLEFLGDSILSFTVSDWLFQQYPQHLEGVLTNLRSSLVKTDSLARMAQQLEIGDYLFLSKGEEESNGRKNPSLLADALEAVIGAIYLDQGYEASKGFILSNLQSPLEELVQSGELKDYKSLLQEKLQAEEKRSPIYKTIKEEGPDHDKKFTVGVFDEKRLLAKGIGKSKQSAEELAAKHALESKSIK